MAIPKANIISNRVLNENLVKDDEKLKNEIDLWLKEINI